jgi:hypothetical protein
MDASPLARLPPELRNQNYELVLINNQSDSPTSSRISDIATREEILASVPPISAEKKYQRRFTRQEIRDHRLSRPEVFDPQTMTMVPPELVDYWNEVRASLNINRASSPALTFMGSKPIDVASRKTRNSYLVLIRPAAPATHNTTTGKKKSNKKKKKHSKASNGEPRSVLTPSRTTAHPMTLAHACRQTRAECIKIFYYSNTFRMTLTHFKSHDLKTLHPLHRFLDSVDAAHLPWLRSVLLKAEPMYISAFVCTASKHWSMVAQALRQCLDDKHRRQATSIVFPLRYRLAQLDYAPAWAKEPVQDLEITVNLGDPSQSLQQASDLITFEIEAGRYPPAPAPAPFSSLEDVRGQLVRLHNVISSWRERMT